MLLWILLSTGSRFTLSDSSRSEEESKGDECYLATIY